MPHDEVLTAIRCARLGIFMADIETSPRYAKATNVKVYDYMTQSIPVIVNDLSICKQTIEEAQCGWSIEYETSSIYSAICSILNDDVALKIKGKNGYEFSIVNYLWENQEPELYRAVFGE
jgi:glycosyltransferase involved in cell wall biosynthesis